MEVRVNLGERSYDIVITSDDAAGIGPFARRRCPGSKALIVSDESVGPRHGPGLVVALKTAGFDVHQVDLTPGEPQKSLATASWLYDVLAEMQADRKTLITALGGGVVGDLAGFVAATFARGLPLLMAPTTLLAMVDSSVGGKVGVNHPRAKNLIGAFYQPVGVWIDTALLATLPDREYRSGLAEVVKYGVILDAELFGYLEANADAVLGREDQAVRHIVSRCCRLKAGVVEQDEREEKGVRVVLNYGHTFAHAFETVGGYGTWLHGEAVAAGMDCAARLAERRGLIPLDLVHRQQALLSRFGLPTVPERWPIDELLAVMRSDKKSVSGRLRLVLPRRLGEVTLFDDVSEGDVRLTLEQYHAFAQAPG
jgi:3-dehydroquinate synthase